MADAPITLREWLREGPFSLALSQGFCCFPALAGALLAIEEALDVAPTESSRRHRQQQWRHRGGLCCRSTRLR